MIGAKPEVQRIVGAEEFGWCGAATVFSNHESRSAFAIMDLQEIKVAGGAVLNVEKREGDPENLVRVSSDDPGTADLVIIITGSWIIRVAEGAGWTF